MDVKVEIPHQLHTAIIGPKGKLVRAVMEECGGVRIRFPPTDSKSDEVTLHGPKDDVEKARTHLMELATEQVRLGRGGGGGKGKRIRGGRRREKKRRGGRGKEGEGGEG